MPDSCVKNQIFIPVTQKSSSQMQQSVKLIKGVNLPQFINAPMSHPKNSHDSPKFRLSEEPLLYVPANLRKQLTTSSKLLNKFLENFENFLRMNPQAAVRQVVDKNEPILQPESDLQKEYDPMTETDFSNQWSLNESVKCYINACISVNLTDRAFAVLMSIRRSNSFGERKLKPNDPELYTDLMAKYSTMQNWSRVNNIYEILVFEKIPMTPQMYMNILDCLGRMRDSKENSSLISEFIKKAENQVCNLNCFGFGFQSQ